MNLEQAKTKISTPPPKKKKKLVALSFEMQAQIEDGKKVIFALPNKSGRVVYMYSER
jgi:hypothetical protein